MRIIIFYISIVTFNILSMNALAQNNNARILELVDKGELGYFDLLKEYTEEGVDSTTLKLANAYLYRYSNRPSDSFYITDNILANDNNLDSQKRFDLWLNQIANLSLLNEHELILDIAGQLLADLAEHHEPSDSPMLHIGNIIHENTALKNLPKSEIIRPDRDVVIPYRFVDIVEYKDKKRNDKAIIVNGNINAENIDMIYDTGCSTTLISKEFAEKSNVKILSDSLTAHGITVSTTTQLGVIDSLRIGEVLFLNAPCAILEKGPVIDSLSVKILLGNDLMDAMNETQIYPKEQKIVFPIEQSEMPPHGINLLFKDRIPFVSTQSNGERLIFPVDTGDLGSSMASNYYERHKEIIEKTGVKDTIKRGELAAIKEIYIYELPEISIKIGETDKIFRDIDIHTTPDCDCGEEHLEDGRMGMQMLKEYNKIVINYRKAFMTVE